MAAWPREAAPCRFQIISVFEARRGLIRRLREASDGIEGLRAICAFSAASSFQMPQTVS